MEQQTNSPSFFEKYQLFFALIICGVLVAGGIVLSQALPQQGGTTSTEAPQTEASVRKDLIKTAGKVGLDKDDFAVCIDTKKNEAKISADVALAERSGVSGTPTFFILKDGKQFTILGARDKATYLKAIEEGKAPADQPAQPQGEKIVLTENDHARGPKDAKVTIVEYSDIDCPFCKRAEPVIEELLAEHPEYRFVYRHSPIVQLHPFAAYKAAATECAQDLGGEEAFWKFLNIVAK